MKVPHIKRPEAAPGGKLKVKICDPARGCATLFFERDDEPVVIVQMYEAKTGGPLDDSQRKNLLQRIRKEQR